MLVNVDPLNPYAAPTPSELHAAGFTGVRLVSRPGIESYVAQLQTSGLFVLAMVGQESNGYVFGGPDAWQFGNEPDVSSPASWTMDATTYAQQFAFYQQTYPQLVWIGAGLASGNPGYWRDVQAAGGLPGAAGFSVHPYGKDYKQAMALLNAYWVITPDLPLWVTEWNRPVDQVPSFKAMLDQSVTAHAWFGWSDAMAQGAGLTDTLKRTLCVR